MSMAHHAPPLPEAAFARTPYLLPGRLYQSQGSHSAVAPHAQHLFPWTPGITYVRVRPSNSPLLRAAAHTHLADEASAPHGHTRADAAEPCRSKAGWLQPERVVDES
jgi:hypothetical protein